MLCEQLFIILLFHNHNFYDIFVFCFAATAASVDLGTIATVMEGNKPIMLVRDRHDHRFAFYIISDRWIRRTSR